MSINNLLLSFHIQLMSVVLIVKQYQHKMLCQNQFYPNAEPKIKIDLKCCEHFPHQTTHKDAKNIATKSKMELRKM